MSVPRARKNDTAPKRVACQSLLRQKGKTQKNNQEEKNEEI